MSLAEVTRACLLINFGVMAVNRISQYLYLKVTGSYFSSPVVNAILRSYSLRGNPMQKLRGNAWRKTWEVSGLPTDKGVLKGAHNLRHTFGRRLRAAGVPIEVSKALLGYSNGDITTHYSAAEIEELREASERIVRRDIAQMPTLFWVKNSYIEKVSEIKTG